MRVCGIANTSSAVWTHPGSARVFFRVGSNRYAATAEEAIELASRLVDAVDALRDGRDFDAGFIRTTEERDGGEDAP
ncbi:hypothetical protein MHPYR_410061 [uncultured Mycobacterium sp.]|uniref:Uncharacterized protein n=1 Tax=uncultured Mycobacterium sp. TaxID=171292 RepID=A0A1Y5PMJ4_9MYCO|nr:hypothetical protein MHPYR_410061 [uncultured Mycobacterium sp.]